MADIPQAAAGGGGFASELLESRQESRRLRAELEKAKSTINDLMESLDEAKYTEPELRAKLDQQRRRIAGLEYLAHEAENILGEFDADDGPLDIGDWRCLYRGFGLVKARKNESEASEKFLIQYIGACGNEALWWRPEGAGYTTNVDEAGRFTEKRAKGQQRERDLDRAWPENVVLRLSHRSVNVGRLTQEEDSQ